MPFKQLNAVIFDMDGVIVDSEPLHILADQVAFDAFRIPVPDEEYPHFTGVPAAVVIENMIAKYAPHQVATAEVLHFKNEWFRKEVHQLKPIEGAIEFVKSLKKQSIPFALATSSSRWYQQYIFERFGLSGLFKGVVTIEDVTHGKPHPAPFLLAAQHLSEPPAACVVIEDSVSGLQGAVAAGCKALGFTSSHSAEMLHAAGADGTADSFSEIAVLLAAAFSL